MSKSSIIRKRAKGLTGKYFRLDLGKLYDDPDMMHRCQYIHVHNVYTDEYFIELETDFCEKDESTEDFRTRVDNFNLGYSPTGMKDVLDTLEEITQERFEEEYNKSLSIYSLYKEALEQNKE